MNEEKYITGTKQWINQVVVGLNFCPFAKKEVVNNTINYLVVDNASIDVVADKLEAECKNMYANQAIETGIIITPQGFDDFDRYLDLVDVANNVIAELEFEGVFQLASFHPHYCFDGNEMDNVENYTNRSPWPMLHIIRESSIEKVLSTYVNPDNIPQKNISLCHEKGIDFFKSILKNAHNGKN